MGALAKEKSELTIELLLTHPVKSWQVLVGKFFSLLSLPVLLTLTSIPLAAAVALWATLTGVRMLCRCWQTWFFLPVLWPLRWRFCLSSGSGGSLAFERHRQFPVVSAWVKLITSRLPSNWERR